MLTNQYLHFSLIAAVGGLLWLTSAVAQQMQAPPHLPYPPAYNPTHQTGRGAVLNWPTPSRHYRWRTDPERPFNPWIQKQTEAPVLPKNGNPWRADDPTEFTRWRYRSEQYLQKPPPIEPPPIPELWSNPYHYPLPPR